MNRADRRKLARKVRRVAAGTDTLTRTERHLLNALLLEASAALPVHIRDQADAAVEQLAANMKTVAAEYGFTTTSTSSPTLTKPIDRVISRMVTGDCAICPHVTTAAPQPLSVCRWDDPPTFRCRRCIPDDAGLTDVEDRTCDLWGRHRRRQDLPDHHHGGRGHDRVRRVRRLPPRPRGARRMTPQHFDDIAAAERRVELARARLRAVRRGAVPARRRSHPRRRERAMTRAQRGRRGLGSPARQRRRRHRMTATPNVTVRERTVVIRAGCGRSATMARRVEEPPRRCGWCSSADWSDPLTGLLVPVYCECDGALPVEPDPRDLALREVDGGA